MVWGYDCGIYYNLLQIGTDITNGKMVKVRWFFNWLNCWWLNVMQTPAKNLDISQIRGAKILYMRIFLY